MSAASALLLISIVCWHQLPLAFGQGTVQSGGPYNDTGYTPSTPGTTVGPETNSLTPPNSLSGSAMQTVVNGVGSGNALFIKGQEQGFSNTSNYNIWDFRPGAHLWSVTSSGAVCDVKAPNGFLTESGGTSFTYSGYTFASTVGDSSSPVWISIVYPPSITGGEAERFDTIVTGASGGNGTVQIPFPYAVTNWSFIAGHDDTSALAQAVTYAYNNGLPGGLVLSFPSTGLCWSRTAAMHLTAVSMVGVGHGNGVEGIAPADSGIVGGAGMDVLVTSPGIANAGQILMNFSVLNSDQIDATQPWKFDNNGMITDESALYRPALQGSTWAANPLGPGSIVGSYTAATGTYSGGNGGVAATTATSTTMCVLTGSVPAPGDDIIFPYVTGYGPSGGLGAFKTTVASSPGTCSSGTAVVLTAAFPATISQAEYYFGEADANVPSGTSIQEGLTAIGSSGRSYPITVTLANPISLQPGYESDFPSWGLVQLDVGTNTELCYFYGNSNWPIQSGPFIKITSCLGTPEMHSSSGYPVTLMNPFEPTWPWPFSNINGSGSNTPVNAEFFPAINVGNAGIAEPQGTGSVQLNSFYNGHVYNISISTWPMSFNNIQENLGHNNTGAWYTTAIPFNSDFHNIKMSAEYGYIQALPATLSGNYLNATADKDVFDHFTINAGIDMAFLSAGTGKFEDFQLFCQNGNSLLGPFQNNISRPIESGGNPATLGCIAGGGWLPYYLFDQTGGPGPWSSGVHAATISSMYAEFDTNTSGLPSNDCLQPGWEIDGHDNQWLGGNDTSACGVIVGGHNNTFAPGPFNQTTNNPAVNFGSYNSFQGGYGLPATAILNNNWGSSYFINYGPGTTSYADQNGGGGPGGQSGDSRNALGTDANISGQTAEFSQMGLTAHPIVSLQAGWISADKMGIYAQGGLATAYSWQPDPTALPDGQGYVSCQTVVGGSFGCPINVNNSIGVGQAIQPGNYYLGFYIKEATNATSGVTMFPTSSCGWMSSYSKTVPLTTTWTWQQFGPINLSSGFTGCSDFSLNIAGSVSASTLVQISGMVWIPIAQQISTQSINLNGATVYSGSGAPTGCGTTYPNGSLYLNTSGATGSMVYVCIGTTWTDIK